MAPRIDDFFSTLNKKETTPPKGIRKKNSLSTSNSASDAQTDAVMKELISSKSPGLQNFQKSTSNINRGQTGDKLETNRGQTGDKPETEVETKIHNTQRLQKNWRQTGDKTGDTIGDKLETNWRQTGDKTVSLVANEINAEQKDLSFSSLTGIQRQLTLYIYEVCKQTRETVTPPLTLEFLSKVCISKRVSIKKSLQRLEEKSVIARKEFKNGRGGWSRYSLSKITFQEILHYEAKGLLGSHLPRNNVKLETNWGQTGDKLGTEAETKPETSLLSSSSVNNIKTTTTDLGTNPGEEMSVDWQTIDFSVLADIGFNKTHLAQLYKAGTQDPKMVQDSIYHFAFDLKHNGKKSGIKGDVLNFFMGIISKRAYTAPTNYINPDVEAMNAYIKTKEQEQKQKEELELKTQDLEFNHWHETLSDEEINQLVSSDTKATGVPKQLQQTLKMNQLKKHFKNFVWPDVKRKILTSTPNWKNI